MIDVFRETRERVTAEDAARLYGVNFDRRGWAVCPFHSDKHPSMSFRSGRFRCWACGAAGDSIDFAGKLFGLEPLAAVEKLNADFALALPLHRKPTPAETQAARRRAEVAAAHKQFEEWRKDFISKLCAAYRVAHIILKRIDTLEDIDRLSEREAMAIRWQPCFEYWADVLSYGTAQEQMKIFRERQVIQSRIDQTLKNTPGKSSAA